MVNIYKNKSINTKIINYNNNFFIIINNITHYIITKISNNIKIKNNYIILNNKNHEKILKWFLTTQIYIIKFKFFGRGYKVITKLKKNILIFNKSHLNILFTKNLIIKINKTNILYTDLVKNKILINLLLNIKKFNIYKKIGIRKHKQIILKKKGKNIN